MRIRMPAMAVTVALSAALFAAPAAASGRSTVRPTVPPEFGPASAICWFGACYNYVSGRQDVRGTGATVQMYQARSALDPRDTNAHSLQELAVRSADRAAIVEIGWIVDPRLNGDSNPHLFVYHWVDGRTTCYNGCGFVSTSSTVRPGMTLTTGGVGTFGITFSGGNWWLSYGGTWIGYFPGSLWNNRFTSFEVVQAFGEVSSTGTRTCNDMGTGVFGSQAGASWISLYALQGTAAAPALTVTATTPSLYDRGQVTATSFRLGGPGTGAC